MTPEEMKDTIEAVKEFAEKDGPSLDAQLRTLRDGAETSWLEGMWDTAYLEYRERTPINVSPAFLLENEPEQRGASQLDRTARLLSSTAAFVSSLRAGTLPVDKEGSNVICMHQYTKLFGAARVPVSGRDELVYCHTARHVVVLSHRQYYVLDILDGSGAPLPPNALIDGLAAILRDSEAALVTGSAVIPNVSILTSDHRDAWAEIYPEVERLNKDTLKAINDSILLVVLDPASPADVDAVGLATLHNMGESRWFDKSLQLVVYKNAAAGVNMEHAGFDGQTLIRWFGDIARDSLKMNVLPTPSTPAGGEAAANFSGIKLKWTLNEKIHVAMGRAFRSFEDFAYTMDMKTLTFRTFGKKAITKHKVSPDAFVQAAFHLAYLRLFGVNRSAYESCSMKRFYHGRTECLRSLTPQLHRFIGLTQCPPSTAQQQVDAAKGAFEAHVNRAKACQQGNGVDRHLWGMLQLATVRRQHLVNFKIPRIYSLPAWKRMRHDHLSTSNCGHDALSYFGFGPTWGDGLGIGYIIKNDVIIATITSFDNKAKAYVDQVQRALNEIYALFENNAPIRTMRAKL